MSSNNPPHAIIYLSEDEHAFWLRNCEANIALGLRALQGGMSDDGAVKMVELLEQFKAMRNKLLEGAR